MSRAGYLAASAAAILWAAGATVAGRMFERGASPLQLTAARSWIGVLTVGALILVVRRTRAQPRRRAPFAHIVVFGAAIAAVNFSYYFAISRLPVAIAIVIQYTAPGLVVLYAAVVERVRPSPRVMAALGLALVGVALLAEVPSLIARGELTLDALGLLAAFGSAISFTAYMLSGQALGARVGPDGALLRGFVVASIIWIVALSFGGRPDTLLDPSLTGQILFVSIGATVAPFLLFLWGIGRVGASRAGIVSTLEPLTAALFAWIWLSQSLDPLQIAGGVMVVAGIAVVQSERPRDQQMLVEAAAVE